MRSDYKGVWTTLSESLSSAKMHVSGTEDEAVLEASGAGTTEFLLNNVGMAPTDVVLEIGCGVGRVGKHLAQHCRRWIGSDVSPNMLKFAAERLSSLPGVEFVELSGNDPAPDQRQLHRLCLQHGCFHAFGKLGSLRICEGSVPRSATGRQTLR